MFYSVQGKVSQRWISRGTYGPGDFQPNGGG